jgi:hypothetical protein
MAAAAGRGHAVGGTPEVVVPDPPASRRGASAGRDGRRPVPARTQPGARRSLGTGGTTPAREFIYTDCMIAGYAREHARAQRG